MANYDVCSIEGGLNDARVWCHLVFFLPASRNFSQNVLEYHLYRILDTTHDIDKCTLTVLSFMVVISAICRSGCFCNTPVAEGVIFLINYASSAHIRLNKTYTHIRDKRFSK